LIITAATRGLYLRYAVMCSFIISPVILCTGIMYFFAENWYKNNRRHQELQKEKADHRTGFPAIAGEPTFFVQYH
jgi:hypothetical protein